MPAHECASIMVLLYADLYFTEWARHPIVQMPITFGLVPMTSSYADLVEWGAASAVEHVGGVGGDVIPEHDGDVAGDDRGAHVLDDCSNGSLGHTVERVHVRRTRGVVDQLGIQERS